jgi:hypothetical protein
MFEMTGKNVDRRSFLRGSALFAAALGMTVVPAVASGQQPQQRPKEEEKPADPFSGEKKEGVLIDEEGREYRVCPQCAYNMYKQGRMWFCENCGYSYVE